MSLVDTQLVDTSSFILSIFYQEKTPIRAQPECLLELTGQDLIGVPVRSPNSIHEHVYVLPLLTILTNKGTGIVTSVPSDSPDDYIALQVSIRNGSQLIQSLWTPLFLHHFNITYVVLSRYLLVQVK
jgi:leucyl-tRNA synthetase